MPDSDRLFPYDRKTLAAIAALDDARYKCLIDPSAPVAKLDVQHSLSMDSAIHTARQKPPIVNDGSVQPAAAVTTAHGNASD
jgi:hypothetical protein